MMFHDVFNDFVRSITKLCTKFFPFAKAYIIPAGMGLILKKGTWHDFPVFKPQVYGPTVGNC